MDIKVLINKMDEDKNTNMSCGGEDAAKATGGLMMEHKKKTNKVFCFTQSRSVP